MVVLVLVQNFKERKSGYDEFLKLLRAAEPGASIFDEFRAYHQQPRHHHHRRHQQQHQPLHVSWCGLKGCCASA